MTDEKTCELFGCQETGRTCVKERGRLEMFLATSLFNVGLGSWMNGIDEQKDDVFHPLFFSCAFQYHRHNSLRSTRDVWEMYGDHCFILTSIQRDWRCAKGIDGERQATNRMKRWE
jgi:hypothetical protein